MTLRRALARILDLAQQVADATLDVIDPPSRATVLAMTPQTGESTHTRPGRTNTKMPLSELHASIELNTPAVLGSARPLSVDPYFKLRPSTVRGGLRYWFRAAAASMLWPAKAGPDENQAKLDKKMVFALRKLEAEIFGDTARRSRVIVLPPKGGIIEPWRPVPDPRNQPGLRYLGYGLFESRGFPPDRIITRPNHELELRLVFRDVRDDAIRQAVAASLWLWTTFGGLGARSRRGYGSMQLVGLTTGDGHGFEPFTALSRPLPKTHSEHIERMTRGIGEAQDIVKRLVGVTGHGVAELENNGEKPHPNIRTLDGIARFRVLDGETDDPMVALEAAGSLFQRYRSSIQRQVPLPDYHAVKASLRPPFVPPNAVERAAFGLPLNFYFRSLGNAKTQFLPRRTDARDRGRNDELDRVASPLLVRVHAIEPAPNQRRYGVTLVNLAGRNTTPLLGCELRQERGRERQDIPAPDNRILDAFIDWAVEESKRRPLRPRSGRRT